MDAVKIEIKSENDIKNREKEERIRTIKQIIVMFLKNELEHNKAILEEKNI